MGEKKSYIQDYQSLKLYKRAGSKCSGPRGVEKGRAFTGPGTHNYDNECQSAPYLAKQEFPSSSLSRKKYWSVQPISKFLAAVEQQPPEWVPCKKIFMIFN